MLINYITAHSHSFIHSLIHSHTILTHIVCIWHTYAVMSKLVVAGFLSSSCQSDDHHLRNVDRRWIVWRLKSSIPPIYGCIKFQINVKLIISTQSFGISLLSTLATGEYLLSYLPWLTQCSFMRAYILSHHD